MAKSRQDFDNIPRNKKGEAAKESQERLQMKTTCRLVESLVEEVFKTSATLHPPIFFGGFNAICHVRLEEHASNVIVRVPRPGLVQFPEKDGRDERARISGVGSNRGE
jgi:hypothetical protein